VKNRAVNGGTVVKNVGTLLLLLTLGTQLAKSADQKLINDVEVKEIGSGGHSIKVLPAGLDQQEVMYDVTNPDLVARLPHLQPGDRLSIWVEPKDGGGTLEALVLNQGHVAVNERAETLILVIIGWLVLGFAISKGRFVSLIMGEDGRYSNSKFQAVVWFSVVIVVYGANLVLRSLRLGVGLMSVNIPQHLLLLSGLSAFSFAAAKGITVTKIQNAIANGAPPPKTGVPSKGLIEDLTTNDSNQLDLGDFQMLVITLVAVATYAVVAFDALGTLKAVADAMMPDVDSTILAAFGLGQGAYLTKKAVGNVGDS
jgi:hypothetical protein